MKVEYLETGINWMDKIPMHWNLVKGKYIFQNKKEINKDLSEMNRLSLTLSGVVRRSVEDSEGLNPNDFSTYQIFEKNNLVFKLIDLENIQTSRVGIVPERGIMSSAYIRLCIEKDFNPNYFYYLYFDWYKKNVFNYLGGGVRATLSSSDLLNLYLPVPPKDEQDEIVQYIKAQEEKINLFIQKKQRFIELLKEQRQILIHQVVTNGINQKVKLKCSGIEWLGDIPIHWEIRRLKECLIGKLKYGANESGEEYNPAGYRYIRITDFSLDGKLSEENKLSLSPEIGAEYELQEGDILFARSGATVGKTFQFHYVSEEEKYCYAGYLIKATPDENIILSDFLFNYTNSKAFENWKNSIFNKATIENIGADKYSVLKIPIPPIEEQKQIVAHIKTETATIDTAITKAEREIELIREYKEAMISEAVMGKMK